MVMVMAYGFGEAIAQACCHQTWELIQDIANSAVKKGAIINEFGKICNEYFSEDRLDEKPRSH